MTEQEMRETAERILHDNPGAFNTITGCISALVKAMQAQEVKCIADYMIATNNTVDDCMKRVAEAERQRDEAYGWLAECYKLSGADPDGNEDWRLAPMAVKAVREHRLEADEESEKLIEAERQRDELRSRFDEALALLRQVEWSSSWADGCPVCAADIEEGHADGCKLGAILAATEKATA